MANWSVKASNPVKSVGNSNTVITFTATNSVTGEVYKQDCPADNWTVIKAQSVAADIILFLNRRDDALAVRDAQYSGIVAFCATNTVLAAG